MAGLAQTAAASQVVVTIKGTVSYGVDQTGVFEAPHTDLTGKKFTLVYTFDDSKVPGTIQNCSGVPCTSIVIGSGSASPGTAVLAIENGSKAYAFGVYSGSANASSEATRSVPPTNSWVRFDVSDYTYGFSDAVQMTIYPADNTPPLATNYDWRGAFSDSTLLPAEGHFGISQFVPASNAQAVSGGLLPTSITVSGPLECSAGTLAPPPATGGVPHGYVVRDPICSTSAARSCTALNVFSVLLLLPTNPIPQAHPATTCNVSSTAFFGPVVQYVDFPDLTVTNVTLPNHFFYPGQVSRSVISENGEIYIQTTGTGTGRWPWVNQHAAEPYWGTVDAAISNLVRSTF
jgi:hypothetical protein